MAQTNNIWNGALLGAAFGGLLGFFFQNKVPLLWSGLGSLSNSIINSWSGFIGLPTNFVSYLLMILIGLGIGIYIEYK